MTDPDDITDADLALEPEVTEDDGDPTLPDHDAGEYGDD